LVQKRATLLPTSHRLPQQSTHTFQIALDKDKEKKVAQMKAYLDDLMAGFHTVTEMLNLLEKLFSLCG